VYFVALALVDVNAKEPYEINPDVHFHDHHTPLPPAATACRGDYY
jgi:hypothetical protein